MGQDKKRVLWEVVGDHVVEEPCDHEDIGLRGFDFNIFDEDEEGVVREECSGPYLKTSTEYLPFTSFSFQLRYKSQRLACSIAFSSTPPSLSSKTFPQ